MEPGNTVKLTMTLAATWKNRLAFLRAAFTTRMEVTIQDPEFNIEELEINGERVSGRKRLEFTGKEAS